MKLVKHQEWLTLPSPPSINQKYISRTFVLSKEYREFKTITAVTCVKEKVKRFVGEVDVAMKWYRPAKRGDIDGVIKPVLDGLTDGGMWEDDRQVAKLEIIRDDSDPKNARMVVKVSGKVEK